MKRSLHALSFALGVVCWLGISALHTEGGAAQVKDKDPGAGVEKVGDLFNGKDLSGWVSRRGGPAGWKVENGYVEVVSGTGDIVTERKFGDCQLHVEFWIPSMPAARGEKRGNSGVYLQGRYEIQILDSFENPSAPMGACGALYGLVAPLKNASTAPETWQSFDITFVAPRVDDQGRVTKPGEVTVLHNGVKILDKAQFDRPTPNSAIPGAPGSRVNAALDQQLGAPGPIMLQDHGGSRSRVRFRNFRIGPLGQALGVDTTIIEKK
jgi:3-keto-disaccharide hydrolase